MSYHSSMSSTELEVASLKYSAFTDSETSSNDSDFENEPEIAALALTELESEITKPPPQLGDLYSLTPSEVAPTDREWCAFDQWLSQVLNLDRKSENEMLQKREISTRMVAFLHFFRLGVPAEEMVPQFFDTRIGWERRGHRCHQNASMLRSPIMCCFNQNLNGLRTEQTPLWFCLKTAQTANLSKINITRLPRVNICHIRQTTNLADIQFGSQKRSLLKRLNRNKQRVRQISAGSLNFPVQGLCAKSDMFHVNQRGSWDCGLACISMVLFAAGMRNISPRQVRKLCGTKSVWSIHLAYLLRHFGIPCTYYTTYSIHDQNFEDLPFYKKSGNLTAELEQVTKLMQQGSARGVNVKNQYLGLDSVHEAAAHGYLCIMLINASDSPDFQGHYVLVCGSTPNKEFVYLDPARDSTYRTVSYAGLKNARSHSGTDDDVIVIGRT